MSEINREALEALPTEYLIFELCTTRSQEAMQIIIEILKKREVIDGA
jgi:hypothetical protein